MNVSLISLELAVVGLGLAFLLLDLWTPAALKRQLGYAAAVAVAILFCFSFFADASYVRYAFNETVVFDPLALYFKRFFLLAGVIVLLLQVEFADRIATGITEYYSLTLFALAGMMFTAAASHFAVMFVALEVVTITFYVLTSFQRNSLLSLEAGVKYLIMGGLSSAFMIFGIAFVYGAAGSFAFADIFEKSAVLAGNGIFLIGLLFVVIGLSFKIAAFPYQIWAPDVYQGAPVPSTAFLAVGSKAAGFVLLLRIVYGVAPNVFHQWTLVLLAMAALSILYGNLCAIAQTSLKRIFGYSSIAHAGYLLLGLAALNASGASAVLYYLTGYLFTVLGAFAVLVIVLRSVEGDEIDAVAGLGARSPLLAGVLTLSMVSLAGIPPLAGFFGKFLLFKAALEEGARQPAFYAVVAVAIIGVVISIWYYFGVIRAIYWPRHESSNAPVTVSLPMKLTLGVCVAGMLFLGLFPAVPLDLADRAVALLSQLR
jgi:NADH-quinone oxidoreductase subunit N